MTKLSDTAKKTPEEGPKEPTRKVRQRRKAARPSEIIEAAIEIFGERGFGASKLEDVARRAGVSKGTVFVYFASKDDLFRAVAQTLLETHFAQKIPNMPGDLDVSLTEWIPILLEQAAIVGTGGLPAVARMLIAESKTFPDLAKTWHDEVISKIFGLLTTIISQAQARGEIRPGDPRNHAFSILGPMMAATMLREVFRGIGDPVADLHALAAQHAETVIRGLATDPG